MPDADDASAWFAHRHWRDESGVVLRAVHAGIVVERPACPVLCIVSAQDEDVPPAATAAFAGIWGASLLRVPSTSHVGPLLGRDATVVATQAAVWLSAR